jgi:hypothetical protein
MLKGTGKRCLCLCVVAAMFACAVFLVAQSTCIPVEKGDKKAMEAMGATLKALGGGEPYPVV